MAGMNPFQLIKLIKTKGPQGAAEMMAQQFSNNPLVNNVLEMGRQGNLQGLEQVAKQIFQQNGRDYATEMNGFLEMMRTIR